MNYFANKQEMISFGKEKPVRRIICSIPLLLNRLIDHANNRRRDCLINKDFVMSNHFIVNQIPSRGKTIVRKLYSGLLLLKKLPLETDIQTSEQGKCSELLFQLIIDIAALCSGDDNWQSTRALLTEAGVPVPEEVNSVRKALDKLMDTDFPKLNRE